MIWGGIVALAEFKTAGRQRVRAVFMASFSYFLIRDSQLHYRKLRSTRYALLLLFLFRSGFGINLVFVGPRLPGLCHVRNAPGL